MKDVCYCFVGEVENAEERTERAKACPCPVHARRGRKIPKDRLRVQFSLNQTSTSCSTSIVTSYSVIRGLALPDRMKHTHDAETGFW